MTDLLLEVIGLKTYFDSMEGTVKAVDDVSFDIKRGETLGVVGESGCGKSVTALSIMQLVPRPKGKIEDGKIYYYNENGEKIDIAKIKPFSNEIRQFRGGEISMIFQEPMTSLNPVYTIGEQIIEGIIIHQKSKKIQARDKAIEMLKHVGISAPEQRVDEYPYQLSGGMRQRVMIAMALSCNPRLLIADEPTTALDVTVEAQILSLMNNLQKKFNMSIQIITHDLGVVGDMAGRINVMYTGKIVEQGRALDIFNNPRHPYTQGLLKSIPKIGTRERLIPIKGSVPGLNALPIGCNFAPRCPEVMEICREQEPDVFKFENEHNCKCWLYELKEEISIG